MLGYISSTAVLSSRGVKTTLDFSGILISVKQHTFPLIYILLLLIFKTIFCKDYLITKWRDLFKHATPNTNKHLKTYK